MNIADERWVTVDGYPDYAISSQGRVKSLRYDQILKPRENSYGLHRVVLYKDKEPRNFYIHLLVASAFLEDYVPGSRVYPLDGNRANNSIHNLRFKNEDRIGSISTDSIPASIRGIMVNETGNVFRTVSDCANYIGGHASSIYRVLRGERPSHLGYTFKYVEADI